MQDATFGFEYYRELKALEERFASSHPGQNLNDPKNAGYKKQMLKDAGIRVRRSVYQDTLADLLESGAPGITRREKPMEIGGPAPEQPLFSSDEERTRYAGLGYGSASPDDDTFGDLIADQDSDAHEFAVLRQNQYESGKPMRYWDEYLASKPSKLQAGVQGLVINATMGFEGGAQGIGEYIGTTMTDIADPQYKYADRLGVSRDELELAIARVEKKAPAGLAKIEYYQDEGAAPTEQQQRLYDLYMQMRSPVVEQVRKDFGNTGRRWARNVTDAFLPKGLEIARSTLVGANPEEPLDIREDVGRGGGGAFVKTMEMTGSALGVMPYSLPAMATRNPKVAAVLTAPFFAMGHSEAWNRRMRIWEQQAAEAEANGVSAPPRPTFGELRQQSNWGGLIEFGSEFTIDRLQVALPGLANSLSKRVPSLAGRSADSVSKSAEALLDSMSRRRGALGVAKTAAVVAAGGATEAIEEAIPELGKEFTDPFYIPEGYSSDFFSAQTAENMGTGFIAGLLFGGGQQAFGKEARMRRAENRRFKQAAEGATSTVVGAITDKASRILRQRFATNATAARGATMASYQVAEIGANKRIAMFVNPDTADVTLTDDVRAQMAQIGIADKPIGRINGLDVYAQAALADDVASYINDGNVSELTGYPELMEPGLSMAGAIVVRNKAQQIVDAIPFSDSQAAEAARPGIEHTAALSGSTVEVVSADGLATLSESMELQVDADATMRKIAPPSKRGLLPQAKARGLEALRIEMSEDALGTKAAGKEDEQFSSPLLTMAEIGNATNKDVEVVTDVSEVPQSQLTEAERNIGKATGANPVIVDAKVTYKITRPDGKVDVYERSTVNNGGYLGEVSPDGLFLIRDNGTAFTSRNAIMLALHEMRHALVGKNRGAAAYIAKLLYLDPAFAMRGGIEYMREYEQVKSLKTGKSGALAGIDDDAAAILHYQASHAAALAVLQDEAGYAQALRTQNDPNATPEAKAVAKARIEQRQTAKEELSEVERFAEESIANVPNRAVGQVGSRALEWEGILKDSNERSMRKFVAYFSHVLARNGWAGPEARQALYELQQRMKGVEDHKLKIQQQMAAEIEKKYRDDLIKHAQMRAQVAPQVPQQAAQPAQPQQVAAPQPGQPGYVGPMQPANIGVRPVQSVSQPGAQPMAGSQQPTALRPNPPQSQQPPAYSMRPRAGAQAAGIALPGGDRDEQIMEASQRLAEFSALPDDQKPSALASVVGILANVIPLLSQTQASLGSTGTGTASGGVRRPTIPPPSTAEVAPVTEAEPATQEMPATQGMPVGEREAVARQRAEPMLSLRRSLRGEWWLTENGPVFADGDYGDMNHAMIAKNDAVNSLSAYLYQQANASGNPDFIERVKNLEQAVEQNNEGMIDSDEMANAVLEAVGADVDTIDEWTNREAEKQPEGSREMFRMMVQSATNTLRDDREYGLAKGWVRVLGNNIQMPKMSDSALKEVADRMYEAEGENVLNQEFTIEDIASRRTYDAVPFEALEKGVRGIAPYRGAFFSMRPDIQRSWEKTSKAVDGGTLTTVYTGSPTGFMEFDSQRMGRTERPVSIGAATSSTTTDGMWFTDSKNAASDAAKISSVNMMPRVSRILNDKTMRLAAGLPASALRKFEENFGMPLKDYRVTPENLAEFMDNDGGNYEGVISSHAKFLSEMMGNDPAAVAKIDQEFQGTDIAVSAAYLAGSRGGVMRGANLNLENPLIVPFKQGKMVSTERGLVRDDEPFITQASDAIDQMQANGNDGIIMEMPDGERRYFVRNPSQVAVTGAARDSREASMLSLRPPRKVDGNLLRKLIRKYAKGDISPEELIDEAELWDLVTPDEVDQLTEIDRAISVGGISAAGSTSVPEGWLNRGQHPLLTLARNRLRESSMMSLRPSAKKNLQAAARIENAMKIAQGQKWQKGIDLKRAMQDQVENAASAEGVDLKEFNEETKQHLINVGLSDAKFALKQNPQAVGWYDVKTRIALAVASLVHPEIALDPNARFAYVYAVAVTSNGLEVGQNFLLADRVYRRYKETGRMDPSMAVGLQAVGMKAALEQFNDLKAKWGLTTFRQFMVTNFKVSELKTLGEDFVPSGEAAEAEVRGASIIGPKIGNGFFANLNGLFDALTMDRWFVRTWSRWTGTLVDRRPEVIEEAVQRFSAAVKSLPAESRVRINALSSGILNGGTALEQGVRLSKFFSKKENRDAIANDSALDELRKAANRVDAAERGEKEAPSGAAERQQMREVMEEILKQLRKDPAYRNLTMADLQAVYWYMEKRLYENAKVTVDDKSDEGYADEEAPDYANASIAVAREAGIEQAAIDQAVRSQTNGLAATARPAANQPQVRRKPGLEVHSGGLARREAFIKSGAIRNVSEGRRAGEPSFAYQRRGREVSLGTGVLKRNRALLEAVWAPGTRLRNRFRAAGMIAPKFGELTQSKASAKLFHAALTKAKASNKHGASVFVYPQAEYAGMRMFLSEDGKTGVAIKPDGDMVSVFSHETSPQGRAAVELAVIAGAIKGDAFDTVLPEIYADHGFKVVSRLGWDDSQAPSDWDKTRYKQFNNGEPDVVFLAYDPSYRGTYSRTDVPVSTDYDAAVKAQSDVVAEISRANSTSIAAPKPSDQVDAMFSIRRGLPGVRDEAMLRYIDKFDELLRYQREAEARGINIPPILNPYIGARLLSGRLGAMQQEAERNYADLLRRMHLDGVTLAEMDEFLTAQHAEERNIYVATINPAFPDGGSGMFTGDARNIIQAAVNNGRFGMLNGYAEEWRQMLRDALDERLANGLINLQTYNNLTARYQNYVPLRGAPVQPNDEDFLDFGEAGGRGLSTTGRGLPASMGRHSEAEAVTSQVGYVHEDTFRRIERNRIGQSFLHLVQAVNDPNMAEVVRPTRRAIVPTYALAPGGGRVRTGEEVRVIHDPTWMTDQRHFGLYTDHAITINGHNYEPGDLIVIRINNRRLADAMTSPSLELRSFERGLRHVNNAWRFMTTGLGNPTFPIANMFRDVLTGIINNYAARGAADTLGMMRRWSGAFGNVFRDSWAGRAPTGSYGDFVAAGGDQLYWRPNDLEVKRADFDAIAERVARRDPNDRTLARALFGWYPAFFEAAEKATRVAQYEQRMATGAAAPEAALAARDLTIDFAKGGQAKPVLNTWYMFLNAGLQGNVNLLRSIQSAPGTVPALIGLGFANAALARFMGGDDEDTKQANVDNIPEYERTSNMYFFDPSGSGKHVKIPLPYGYNVFFSIGVRMADAVYGRKTSSDVLNGTLVDALNAFNPMGGSGIKSGGTALVAAAVPTMARPAIELLGNEDFAGRPIAPTVFDRFPGPRSQNAFDGTPEGYKRFAETVNSMTGGDEFEAGMIDASPNHIQYLLGYYFSGTGRLLDRVYKAALSNEEVTANDLPVLRSFVGDAKNDTRALSQNFYGLLEEIAPARRRMDFATDEANPLVDRQRAAANISNAEMANAEWMKLYEKELTRLRKQLKTATPEQRQAIFDLRKKMLKAAVAKKNELTDIGLGVE